jgi:5-methylcytosine-specific restriction endonuclease McrA
MKAGYVNKCKACALKDSQEWRSKNKDIVRLYDRKYQSKRNAIQKKRETFKLQRTPSWLTEEHFKEIELFYQMAKELETIFPWKQHVDHIVPLNGKQVSGFHAPWNLQILSAKANMQKGNRYYE